MAKMVTRTVKTTEYNVMVVTPERAVDNLVVSIASVERKTDKQIAQEIRENLPEGYIFVQVVSSETKEILYGMAEELFIAMAEILPNR